MVKDESARIRISLDSTKNLITDLAIYDTGSTDGTPEIIKKWCDENKVRLHLISGKFVDFSTSRNVLMEYLDTISNVEWWILLDGNDEVQNIEAWRRHIKELDSKPNVTAVLCHQIWKTSRGVDSYYNVRLVKSNSGYRYHEPIHEYIASDKGSIESKQEDLVVYQDRIMDEAKSIPRYQRDTKILFKEITKRPNSGRSWFYLGQSCQCTGDLVSSFRAYQIRTEKKEFYEEIFHSYLRSGEIGCTLGYDWLTCHMLFIRAFTCLRRAEPLLRLSSTYIDKDWPLAYLFAKIAAELDFPQQAILFVGKEDYDYTRWHLLGRIAFYVGKHIEGKKACQKAFEYKKCPVDKDNLKFYTGKDIKQYEEIVPEGLEKKLKELEKVAAEGSEYPPEIESLGKSFILADIYWRQKAGKDAGKEIRRKAWNYYMKFINESSKEKDPGTLSLDSSELRYKLYIAKLRAGMLACELGYGTDEAHSHYIDAFRTFKRIDPLVKMAELYIDKNWELAAGFASLACDYFSKEEERQKMDIWSYYRWHLLGRTAYYANRLTEGKEACEKAYLARELPIDKKNIAFYEDMLSKKSRIVLGYDMT